MSFNFLEYSAKVVEEENEVGFGGGRWILHGKLATFTEVRKYLCSKSEHLYESVTKLVDQKELEQDLISEYMAENRTSKWPLPRIALMAKEKGPIGYIPDMFSFLDMKTRIIFAKILFHFSTDNQHFFYIQGTGGSGKSTVLNVIRQLLDDDYSVADPSVDLGKFDLVDTIGKRLISNDDIAGDFRDNSELKKVAMGEPVRVHIKMKESYTLKEYYSNILFLGNLKPVFDITDRGMTRRAVWHKMDKVAEKPDPSLKNRRYTDEELVPLAQYLLSIEIGMEDKWMDFLCEETTRNILEQDNVYQWKTAKTISDDEAPRDYSDYVAFCADNGKKECNRDKFREKLNVIQYAQTMHRF